MACEKCKTINTPDCDTDLCDIVLPADCVTVKKLECLDNENGSTLQSVLEGLDEAICEIESECTPYVWVNITNGREGIETLQHTTTCQNEVKLKGTVDLDDYVSGGTAGFTFPVPPVEVSFSLNFIDVSGDTAKVAVGVFKILTDGTCKFYFNQSDILSDPPTITIDFTGLSYFIN